MRSVDHTRWETTKKVPCVVQKIAFEDDEYHRLSLLISLNACLGTLAQFEALATERAGVSHHLKIGVKHAGIARQLAKLNSFGR